MSAGENFELLTSLAIGYNAYEATLDAYVSADGAFAALPTSPLGGAPLRCHARLCKLVSPVSGTLVRSLNHADELAALQSLVRFEPAAAEAGDVVRATIDLDSCAGDAFLAHADPEVLAADYAVLRALQPTMWDVG